MKLLKPTTIESQPFPYAFCDPVMEEETFADLERAFPSNFPPANGGRSQISSTQPGFQEFLCSNPVWTEVWQYMKSPHFQDFIFDIFQPHFPAFGYKHHGIGEPTLDIVLAGDGYVNTPHLDFRHHIAQVIFYFGTGEIESGGDINIYDSKGVQDKIRPSARFPIKESRRPTRNSGLIWLNTRNSYHGAWPELKGKRRFCYMALNSDLKDAWKA